MEEREWRVVGVGSLKDDVGGKAWAGDIRGGVGIGECET